MLERLFLIHGNDLSNDLKSQSKLLGDDTPLFSVVHDVNTRLFNGK